MNFIFFFEMKSGYCRMQKHVVESMGNRKAKGGFTPLFHLECSDSPPEIMPYGYERKEGDTMYVTYQDLIQIGILVVALANLFYQIYKGKKK